HAPDAARDDGPDGVEGRPEEVNGPPARRAADVRPVVRLEERAADDRRERESEVDVAERHGRHEPAFTAVVERPHLGNEPGREDRSQTARIDVERDEREVDEDRGGVEPATARAWPS